MSILPSNNYMGIGWTYPYMSGAANLEKLFEWRINADEYKEVENLSFEEYRKHRHKSSSNTVSYTTNFYGYVLVVYVSKKVFPWVGDVDSVRLFQLMIHLFSCILIIALLNTYFQKYLFLLIYSSNPIIIYFVIFPFYYFWLFLPSFSIILLLLMPKKSFFITCIFTPLMLITFMIRPTVILLILAFYSIAFYQIRDNKKKLITSIILIFTLVIYGLIPKDSAEYSFPWHIAYKGIGAYPNETEVFNLYDDRGYYYFNKITGIKIDGNPISGNLSNPEIYKEYNAVIKKRYLEILREKPSMLVNNAIKNSILVFSPGYIVNRDKINVLNMFIGVLVIIIFLITKQYLLLIFIYLSALPFVLYYPPIIAYNFSAYLLISFGIINGADKVLNHIYSQ